MTLKSQAPFFSICIPAYNNPELLKCAIRSVLDQNFDDYELLVQDDASSDNIEAAVTYFRDDRISFERNAENLGIFANLNILCGRATGRYIKILCADDVLASDCLRTTFNIIRRQAEMPRLIAIRETGRQSELCRRMEERPVDTFVINRDNLFGFLCRSDNWGGGLAELCVDREFFKARGFFGSPSKTQDFSRDIITWFGMALDTDVLMIDRPMVYQRPHPGQARHHLPRINQLREMFQFFYEHENELKHLCKFEQGRKISLDRYLISHYWYGIKCFLRGKGSTYIIQVFRLTRRYNHGNVSLHTFLLRVLSRLMPVRIWHGFW